jgi:hypothetical protein
MNYKQPISKTFPLFNKLFQNLQKKRFEIALPLQHGFSIDVDYPNLKIIEIKHNIILELGKSMKGIIHYKMI